MSLEPQNDADDYRLADYKPLLPLTAGARVLIGARAAQPSLAHLARDLDTADELRQADSQYDLAIGSEPNLAEHLQPGAWLCLLGPPPVDRGELRLVCRWRALPGWPAFRALVPANAAGYRAALQALRLLPARSPAALLGRLSPRLGARLLPDPGVALYTRGPNEDTATSCLLACADRALGATEVFRPERWLIVSGRLGPGNPILAFQLDDHGHPVRLIKLARDRGAKHLAVEAKQIAAITEALGPALSQRVIAPTAAAEIEGRHALAYRFVPTRPFHGLRWRLQGRRGLCSAMTDWLIQVARQTRRAAGPEIDEAVHRQPLRQLLDRRILPARAHEQARQALNWLQQRATLPTVFEHGDLGVYNLRLLAANGSDFKVLDWGSSTFDGIGAGDLLYLLSSARAPARLAAACLRSYLQALELPNAAAAALWWAYLARRWAELDTIRPPQPDQPESGGGLLLSVHAQVNPALTLLGGRP